MECLSLIQRFFAELSQKTKIKIKLDFEATLHDDDIPKDILEKLLEVKDILVSNEDSESQQMKKVIQHQCKKCRKRFSCEEILQFHTKTLHESIKTQIQNNEELPNVICCIVCYKSYQTILDFETKDVCESKIYLPQDLVQKHNHFICNLCSQSFKNFERISSHLIICQNSSHFCQSCHINFQSKQLLVNHLKTIHFDPKPFLCDFCPKKFKTSASLKKHSTKNHQNTLQTHQCDLCPKKFIKKIYLTNHKFKFHNLDKSFMCNLCGKMFLTETSLKTHLSTHENPLHFQCEVCNKEFHRKDKYENHVKIHTGIKPFGCQICSKYFITSTKLKEHERRHKGEKRFTCLLCHKKYSGSFDLRKHVKKMHSNVSLQSHVPITPQILAFLKNE